MASTACTTLIDGPEGRVRVWPDAFGEAAAEWFTRLQEDVAWQAEWIRMFGKVHEVPRRVAWHGDADAAYRYAGVSHAPQPWIPVLQGIRERTEAVAGEAFNSVLLNRYRTGRDHMGWHRDNEPELGPAPTIASVSLGAERRFDLRHTVTKERISCSLPSGSLLIMDGPLQLHWKHRMPPVPRLEAERINLTFRRILNRSKS